MQPYTLVVSSVQHEPSSSALLGDLPSIASFTTDDSSNHVHVDELVVLDVTVLD